MAEEGVDTYEDLKEAYKSILSLTGGVIKHVQSPEEDLPEGIADILATWPGIADDPHWRNHPQLRAYIERGWFGGGGKWVYRNKERVFLKDFVKYEFDKERRCWRRRGCPSG